MSPRVRMLTFTLLFLVGLSSPFLVDAATRNCFMVPREVARLRSPNWQNDIVIVTRQPRLPYMKTATEVYLVAHGQGLKMSDVPVFSASQAEAIQGQWKDAHLVEIRYARARIDSFSAVWPPLSLHHQTPSVEIRLTPPAAGASFSPGDNS